MDIREGCETDRDAIYEAHVEAVRGVEPSVYSETELMIWEAGISPEMYSFSDRKKSLLNSRCRVSRGKNEDQRRVLGEFARVLDPGATLLVTEGGIEWSGSNPDWLDSGTGMRWSMAGVENTRSDLLACGFEVQGVWYVQDPTTEDSEKPFFLATREGNRDG